MPVIATPLPQRLRSPGRMELNRCSWQAAGLTGWWPLGSPDGPIIRDLSGYGNHLLVTRDDGGMGTDPWSGAWSAPDGRNSLDMSGSINGTAAFYAKTEPGLPVSAECTVSFWHRPYVSVGTQTLFALTRYTSTGQNFYLNQETYYSRGRVQPFWVNEAGSYDSFSWTDNSFVSRSEEWQLITLVRRGGTGAWYADLYKNGDLYLSQGAKSTDPPTGTDYKMYVGAYRDGSLSAPSGGHTDDLRLYNRSLGAAEVKAIYLDTKDGSYGDLARQPTRFHHLSASAAVGKGSRTAMFLGVE